MRPASHTLIKRNDKVITPEIICPTDWIEANENAVGPKTYRLKVWHSRSNLLQLI